MKSEKNSTKASKKGRSAKNQKSPGTKTFRKLKPIFIYDHLPDILCGYPMIAFLALAGLSVPQVQETLRVTLSQHTLFWLGAVVVVAWFIAFRYNLPKSRFWLVFGLLGTFVGIPVILEVTTGHIAPFAWLGRQLGSLAPEINTGGWLVGSLIFGIAWLCSLVWSRTHLQVRLDESGLTIKRLGGRGERFDLIGLKTEDEPIDYLESFIAGIGTLSLKTRMNKPIFTMKRVVGLYRSPLTPWRKGKLARIEEMLSFQGKVLSIDSSERTELAEAADNMDADMDADMDDDSFLEDDRDIDAVVVGDVADVPTANTPDID